MATWHRLGPEAELRAQAPLAIKVERHRIAIFVHDGQLRAISDICNHRGGPLSEGRLRGEFVMCPWHAWEYSVVTGKGPEGYDEEQVPVYVDSLSKIFDFVAQLDAADTASVEPMAHPLADQVQRMRPDEVLDSDQHTKYQRNAPRVEADLYLVPKVIE